MSTWNLDAAIATSRPLADAKNKPERFAEIVLTEDLFAGDFGDGTTRTWTDELRIAKRGGSCRECARGIKPGDLVRVVKMSDADGFYGGRVCEACCDDVYAEHAEDEDEDDAPYTPPDEPAKDSA